jgi:hypothetical protein
MPPRSLIAACFGALAAVTACTKREAAPPVRVFPPTPGKIVSAPLPLRPAPAAGETLFELLPAAHTGIDFQLQWDHPEIHIKEFLLLNPCGGVCAGDYDGDGLPDIYVTSPSGGNRLFRNLGDFKFEDATESAGITDESFWGTGASFVDIDNDGDLDLFACGYTCPNKLLINDGQGHFTDQAAKVGLAFDGASMMMSFADIDNDGDLDGYLATTGKRPPEGTEFKVRFEKRAGDGVEIPVMPDHLQEFWELLYLPGDRVKRVEAAQFDRLFRNDSGNFTEVAAASGIVGPHFTLSATWWDYDEDGDPDLYVSNDYTGPDHLYRNRGDGTFEDVIAEVLPHTPWFSMGSDVGDLDGDGRIDLFASDMSATSHYRDKLMMGNMDEMGWFLEYPEPRQYMRNAVYLNTGAPRMREGAFLLGTAGTDWTWTPRLEDFDGDGRVDVFVTNGVMRDNMNSDLTQYSQQTFKPGSQEYIDFWLAQPMRKERNHALRNLGDAKFEKTGEAWGLDREGVSFGAATADFDGDGDPDLVVSNADAPLSIYRNRAGGAHRAVITLKGVTSNADGLGATVHLRAGGRKQTRFLTLARGWQSAGQSALFFGLGQSETIDELTVVWPGGSRQRFTGLAADQSYTITEAVGQEQPPAETKPAVLFAASTSLDAAVHKERPFDDFAAEPLLPNRQSRLGPPLAWGDIDGDGDDDLFLGGAAGAPGRLLRNDGGGRFEPTDSPALVADASSEDAVALLVDFDADGDADLFIGSGGVESPADDAAYRDRLYLNDGKGTFSAAPVERLPDRRTNTSAVAAADFDRDGDLDLFVGSRGVPGHYPLPQSSALLVHSSSAFVVSDLLPSDPGLVTGALWSDANGDGWLDLLVTVEWGPTRLFLNREGRLEETTDASGLGARLGWWNGISGGDIDGDGDIDYLVTNFGLNTKYKASAEKPEMLYYGDFDGSGKANIVEAKYEGDTALPRRGFSCSQQAMPFLHDKMKTFHNFASASLTQLYTEESLESSVQLKADTLETGLWINDGAARFTWQPLPRIAQIAPSFGSALADLDADGDLDIALAQNSFSPQRETGRMDGGLGEVLLNDGSGSFTAPGPAATGIVVSGDAKSLTLADLNADGRPDLAFGMNDAPVAAFTGASKGRWLAVRLGADGIGARVTIGKQTRELHVGSGYRSQEPPVLWFAAPEAAAAATVLWPDGTTSQHPLTTDATSVILSKP